MAEPESIGAGPPGDPRSSEVRPVRAKRAPLSVKAAGYAMAAAGASLFATKGIIIKLAYRDHVTAEALLTLRLGLSAPVYIAIGLMAVSRGRGWPEPRLIAQTALVGALGYWFASYTDFLGLNFISVQFERLILFTYPAFVVLFGAILFRQRVRPAALTGIALSYAGLVLMFATKLHVEGPSAAKGAGLVLSAAIAFAFYQLLAKGLIARMGARLFTCIAMLGAAAATFVQFALTQPMSSLVLAPEPMAYAAVLAVGATILPSFFLNAALERISPQANSAIATLSPVITIALAVAILGETVTWTDAAATALVLAGVGWFTLSDMRRPATQDG